MTENLHSPSTFTTLVSLTAVALLTAGVSFARGSQRCDDIADELKSQIDGLKIGITAHRTIYLSHPQASELSLVVLAAITRTNYMPRRMAES